MIFFIYFLNSTNIGDVIVFPYSVLKQIFAKGYRTNYGVTLGSILDAHLEVHFVPPHCLSGTFIPNFGHHQFFA
jgi:hypothetical protein